MNINYTINTCDRSVLYTVTHVNLWTSITQHMWLQCSTHRDACGLNCRDPVHSIMCHVMCGVLIGQNTLNFSSAIVDWILVPVDVLDGRRKFRAAMVHPVVPPTYIIYEVIAALGVVWSLVWPFSRWLQHWAWCDASLCTSFHCCAASYWWVAAWHACICTWYMATSHRDSCRCVTEFLICFVFVQMTVYTIN